MNQKFELTSTSDFRKFYSEDISELLDAARKNNKATIYTTSALVLYLSALETFMENSIEECIDHSKSEKFPINILPPQFKLAHVKRLYSEELIAKAKHSNDSLINNVIKITTPIVKKGSANDCNVEIKFSYGKHGENDIVRLFSILGIANIFTESDKFLECYIFEKSKIAENSAKLIDKSLIINRLNALINMRNQIIHTCANPSVTWQDLLDDFFILNIFVEKLSNILNNKVQEWEMAHKKARCMLYANNEISYKKSKANNISPNKIKSKIYYA